MSGIRPNFEKNVLKVNKEPSRQPSNIFQLVGFIDELHYFTHCSQKMTQTFNVTMSISLDIPMVERRQRISTQTTLIR